LILAPVRAQDGWLLEVALRTARHDQAATDKRDCLVEVRSHVELPATYPMV
jgi:hypothetical protein